MSNLENLENGALDQELNIDEIPATEVKFNEEVLLNGEGLSDKEKEKYDELNKRFENISNKSWDLLVRYDAVRGSSIVRHVRDNEPELRPTIVLNSKSQVFNENDRDITHVRVFDKEKNKYYELSLETWTENKSFIVRLKIFDDNKKGSNSEEFSLDLEQYEEMLKKIENVLNKEEAEIKRLEEEKKQNVNAKIGGL